MTSPTDRWPSVSVNGSRRSNAAAIPSSTAGRGTAGIAAAACRRWASAACMVNASSHLSRLRRVPQVVAVGGPVDRPQRQLARPQVVPLAHLGGQRVLARVQGVEHGADVPGDRPRGQLGGRRVDRDQLGGELLGELGGQPVVGGRDREQLVLGVHQLAAAAEAGHRAGEQGERALLQLLGVEPDAVEERELQLARAVGDDDLEPLLRAAAVRSLPRLAGDWAAEHGWTWPPGRAR